MGRWIIILISIVIQCELSIGQMAPSNKYLSLPDKTNAFVGWTKEKELLLSSINGWVKFDGLKSIVYDIHSCPDLIDHNIQSHFYTAPDGKVWFCSYQALISYVPSTGHFEQKQLYKDNLKFESDYYVFHLENDTLYGRVNKEFFIFDTRTGETTFTGLFFDNPWIKMTRAGKEIHLINYFRRKNTHHYVMDSKSFEIKSKTSLPFRTDDLKDKGNFEWLLATDQGLINYNLISGETTSVLKHLEGKNIISIEYLGHQQWLCSDEKGGIYLIEGKKVKVLQNLLPGNPTIHHIWYSDDKIILSSYGIGVFILSRNLILFDRFIFPITYYPRQMIPLSKELFVTSFEYPPIRLNYGSHKLSKPLFSETGRILFSSLYRDGIILTTDRDTQMIYVDNSGSAHTIAIPDHIKRIHYIQYHESADHLSISTYSGMVYLGTLSNDKFILVDSIVADSAGIGIGYVISTNHFLIASINEQYGNVYQKENGKYTFRKRIPLQGSINMTVLDEKKNCLWIGSQYGLKKLNFNTLLLEQVNHQHARYNILGLLRDKLNRLWFSTENGLFLYIPETDLLNKFGIYDGLPNTNFTAGTASELHDGKFLFGGSFGWVEFYPEKFHPVIDQPTIVLRQILYNDNRKIDVIGVTTLNLSYDINAISFDFSATTLLNGEDNNLKYRLFPEDTDFIEVGSANGFTRYTHLSPGKYQFQILAANLSGKWSEEMYKIDLAVLPPWWKTPWFIALAIIAVSIIIYTSFRSYYKRQLEKKDLQLREQKLTIEKQEAVQQERIRIAGEMHDDLGSGLTTIKYLSDKALKNVTEENEIENIRKISKESNDLVRNMSEIIWAMNDRFDTLENLVIYIRRYAYEYLESYNLDFSIDIQENIPAIKISGEKRRNVFLVVKEALHNVVKHSQATSALIKVTFDENLNIIIKDNGQETSDTNKKNFGNGLHNMQGRMNKIGGSCLFINKNGWEVNLKMPFTIEN